MSTPWSKIQENLREIEAFKSEFEDLGFDVDREPSRDGWVPVHLPERFYGTEDKNRSGSVNVNTGFIHNFRDGSTLSLWDWYVEHGLASTWKEAQDLVLKKYGLATTYATKKSPQYKVKWEPWVDQECGAFQTTKKVHLGGILRSGAVLCQRLGEPLFAWKVLDSKMETVGYHFIPRSGKESTVVKGAKSYTKRWEGAESGFIGDPAVAALFREGILDEAVQDEQGGIGEVCGDVVRTRGEVFEIVDSSGVHDDASSANVEEVEAHGGTKTREVEFLPPDPSAGRRRHTHGRGVEVDGVHSKSPSLDDALPNVEAKVVDDDREFTTDGVVPGVDGVLQLDRQAANTDGSHKNLQKRSQRTVHTHLDNVDYEETGGGAEGVESVTKNTSLDAIESHKNLTIIWTEGVSDLVALYSKYPDVLALSNPHGCSENVSSEQAALLDKEGVEVWIIADADEPGILGATKKRDQLISLVSKDISVRVFTIPGEVQSKHGKDLRDFLSGQTAPSQWQLLPTHLTNLQDDSPSVGKLQKKNRNKETTRENRAELRCVRSLQTLGLTILSRTSKDCVVYCEHRRALFDVDLTRIPPYEYFLANVGPRFSSSIDQNPGGRNKSFDDFKKELAIAASSLTAEEGRSIGAGIWGLKNENGAWNGEILLVSGKNWRRLKDGRLLQDSSLTYGSSGYVDLNNKRPWLDMKRLEAEVNHPTPPESLHREIMDSLDSWLWENPKMPEITAGLYYATWIQELFSWRPIVTLTGESTSGKTTLATNLMNLYLGLLKKYDRSTAAGVQQHMANTCVPTMIDESDTKPVETQRLLEFFRTSGSGSITVQGTSRQVAKVYEAHHLPWIIGIYGTAVRQADLNRHIPISLHAPEEAVTVKTIPLDRAVEIGYQVLARVLKTAATSVQIAKTLGQELVPGYDIRFAQSYAVPYAATAAFLGKDLKWARQKMREYLSDDAISSSIKADTKRDWEVALTDILNAVVNVRGVHYQVAHLLFYEPSQVSLSNYEDAVQNLNSAGVKVVEPKKGRKKVAISPSILCQKRSAVLLPARWTADGDGKALAAALRTCRGGMINKDDRVRMGAGVKNCLSMDFETLEKWARQNLDLEDQILETDDQILSF